MAKKKYNYFQTLLHNSRQIWARRGTGYPPRLKCFADAKVKVDGGMEKWRCAKCAGLFALSEVACDHKIPIAKTIPLTHEEYQECDRRLHCSIDQLQILCLKCHKQKTRLEVTERKKADLLKKIFGHIRATDYTFFENNPHFHDYKTLQQIGRVISNIEKHEGEKKAAYIEKLQHLLEKYL